MSQFPVLFLRDIWFENMLISFVTLRLGGICGDAIFYSHYLSHHSHTLSPIDNAHPFPINPFLAKEKDSAGAGIEPLTHWPRSSTLTSGPPRQISQMVSYLVYLIACDPVLPQTVAHLSAETASVAAEPFHLV